MPILWNVAAAGRPLHAGRTFRGSDHGLLAMVSQVRSGDDDQQPAFEVNDLSLLSLQNRWLNYGYAVLRAMTARAVRETKHFARHRSHVLMGQPPLLVSGRSAEELSNGKRALAQATGAGRARCGTSTSSIFGRSASHGSGSSADDGVGLRRCQPVQAGASVGV